MPQSIILASDHRGFALKAKLKDWLASNGYDVADLGPPDDTRCDAVDYAQLAAEKLRQDDTARAVLICGSGQAMTMTANRYRHIRAALCHDAAMARLTREHNDANVLVLGADFISAEVAQECLEVFLQTDFLGGRYAERLDKLTKLGGL